MNNKSSGTEYTAPQRIITPLAPKRVPSVAPGLEGLAAMAPDSCEAAPPETMAPVPEFVVSAAEALAAGQLPETQIAFSASGGDDWGQFSFHEAVALPAARGDAAISHGTNFDGNVLTMSKAGAINSAGIESTMWNDFSEVRVTTGVGKDVSFDLELVGAMENGAIANLGWISHADIGSISLADFEPAAWLVWRESEDPQALLSDYKAFLADTPGWVEKFSQPSQYFGDLVFGTSEEATNFDNWFIEEVSPDGVQDHHNPKTLLTQFKKYASQNDLHDHLLESSYFEEIDFRTPAETSAFDSWYEGYHCNADVIADYKAFLADTPGWVEKFSQPSIYFGDLVFGTDNEAIDFDNWFIEEVSPDGVQDHHNPQTLLAQFTTYAAQNDLHDGLSDGYGLYDLDFRTPAEGLAFDAWYSGFYEHEEVMSDYKAFLADTPGWVEQFSQPSQYFGGLVFGSCAEATDFDAWFIEEVSPDGVQNHHSPQTLLAQFKTYAAQNDFYDYLTMSDNLYLDFRTPAEALAFDAWYEEFEKSEELLLMSGDTDQGNWSLGNISAMSFRNLSAMSFSQIDADGDQVRVTTLGKNVTFDIDLGGATNNADIASINLNDNHSLGVVVTPASGALVSKFDDANDNEVILELVGDRPALDQIHSNTLTISNSPNVKLQDGEIVPGKTIDAFNPDAVHADIQLHAEPGASLLPFEILADHALGVAEAITTLDAAVGPAPTLGAALVVEFDVLSPSNQLPDQLAETCAYRAVTADVPLVVAADVDSCHALAGSSKSVPDAAQPSVAGQYEGSCGMPNLNATNVAAAVATGIAAQGSGVAPSMRRPLAKI